MAASPQPSWALLPSPKRDQAQAFAHIILHLQQRRAVLDMTSAREWPDVLTDLIVPYAVNPMPKPLSQPERNDIRQGRLCALSLTCKRLQHLCEPLLYSHVLTDSLPLFLSGVHKPSSRRLYNRVRTLRIEYAEKCVEPTYTTLFKIRGLWEPYGQLQKMVLWHEWEREIAAINDSLKWAEQPGLVKALFPRLTKVIVASLYGMEGSDKWELLEMRLGHLPENPTLMNLVICSQRFDRFLHGADLQDVCIRDHHGPLSLSSSSHSNAVPYKFTPTVHFTARTAEVDLPYNSNIRYIGDIPPNEPFYPVRQNVVKMLGAAAARRRKEMDDVKPLKPPPGAVEIYCTTANGRVPKVGDILPDEGEGVTRDTGKPLSLALQRRVGEVSAGMARKAMREATGLKDEVRWLASPDTPMCCCGTGPPESSWRTKWR